MLDQNTDRSWWMIGAVVIGAALIVLAKTEFPSVFTAITGKFTQLLNGISLK